MKQILLSYSGVYLNTVTARSVEERSPHTWKCSSVCRLRTLYNGHLQQRRRSGQEVKWDWKENEARLMVRTSQERLVLGVGGIFR